VFAKWKQICPAVKTNTNAWVFNGNNVIYSTQSIARIQDIEGIVIPVDEHVGSLLLYFKNCNSFHQCCGEPDPDPAFHPQTWL
jgi:hypothetical protein